MKKRSITTTDVIRCCALSVLFVGLTMILYYAFKGSDDLKSASELQKLIYPLGLAGLLSGLATVWLAALTGRQEESVEKPAWFYPIISAFLAFCGMGLAYVFLGIWPIGERSGMIVDMHHQYAPLLSQLREMLLNGGDPFYSFDVGLGASFLPLFGYYLASPFNLLLVFFPEHLLAEGIIVITLLKNMLTAGLFALCVQSVYRRRTPAIPMVAVMYSMMMYLLAYSWNIMWLDVVMVLPLVVMGFERLMHTGKYLTYVLSLAYALYANYYIGFMLCVFMVIYYVAFLFRSRRTPAQGRSSLFRFALGSLLGGGLAMFLLVPVYLALGQTSAAGASLPDLKSNFDMFNLLGRHLYEVSPTIRSGNLPNIYCGVLAMFLLPVFALNQGIPRRRRAVYVGMLAVMGISLVINQIDLLWHGFHSPNDLPYRFSFIYSFVLLLIAYEALLHMETVRPKQLLLSFGGIAAYLMLEERFGDTAYGFTSIYATLLLIGIYAAISLLIVRRHMLPRVGYCLMLLVVMTEMTLNAGSTFRQMQKNEYFTAHDNYVDNDTVRAIQAAVDRTQEIADSRSDGEFYRMELLPRRLCMDTALFHYPGITSFASSNSYMTTRLMGGLGYAVNGVNSYQYRSFMASADSLLGIRYIVLDKNIANHQQLQQIDSVTYGEGDEALTYYIYENKDALPIAYRVNSDIKGWSSSYYNPLETQNSLYRMMTGDARPLYTAMEITAAPGYETVFKTQDTHSFTYYSPSAGSTGTLNVDIAEAGQYFLYVDCRAADGLTAKQGGNTWNITTHEPYFIDLGSLQIGDSIQVDVKADSTCSGNVYALKLNEDVLNSAVQKLKADGLRVTEADGHSLKGTVSASADGVMFTSISYDAGWTIKVDGKTVQTYGCDISEREEGDTTGGAMLAFDLPAGEHTVEMTFQPRGLVPGVILSIVSLGLLIVVAFLTSERASRIQKPVMALFDREDLDPDYPAEPASAPADAGGEESAASGEAEEGLFPPENEMTAAGEETTAVDEPPASEKPAEEDVGQTEAPKEEPRE